MKIALDAARMATTRSKKTRAKAEFVDQVLDVDGPLAAKIAGLARRKRPAARAQVIAALGQRVARGHLPAWLNLAAGELGEVLHLAPPMFACQTEDEDEYYNTFDELLVLDSYGELKLRGGDDDDDGGAGEKPQKLSAAALAKLDGYDAEAIVLHTFVWHESPPKEVAAFKKLMRKAGEVVHRQLEVYEVDAFEPSPPPSPGRARVADTTTLPEGVFLGGPARSSCYPGPAPRRRPKTLWVSEAKETRGGEKGGAPVKAGGLIFAGVSWFNINYAATTETGKKAWAGELSKRRSWPAGSACAHDGVVYAPTNVGLYALDAKRGKVKWVANAAGMLASSPLVIGGLCTFGSEGALNAVDVATGRKRWRFAAKGHVSPPAYADGVLFFRDAQHVYALEAVEGKKVLWKTKSLTDTAFQQPQICPVVCDDRVVFPAGAYPTYLVAAQRSTGQTLWRHRVKQELGLADTNLAVGNGMVVYRDSKSRIVGVDLRSGKERWMFKPDYDFGSGGPAIVGNVALVVLGTKSLDGQLVGLDLSSGKLLWRLGGSSRMSFWQHCTPCFDKGVIYAQADALCALG